MTTVRGKHAGPRPVDEPDWPDWDVEPAVVPAHAADVWPPQITPVGQVAPVDTLSPAPAPAGPSGSTATLAPPAWAEDERDVAADAFLASIAAEAAPRPGLPTGLVQPERGRREDERPERRPRSHAADTRARTDGSVLLVLAFVAVLALGVLAWLTWALLS